MVRLLYYGNVSLPRNAKVRCLNAKEDVSREKYRSVCGLVKICAVDKCDLTSELGAPIKDIDFKFSKWLILFNFPCGECKVIVD